MIADYRWNEIEKEIYLAKRRLTNRRNYSKKIRHHNYNTNVGQAYKNNQKLDEKNRIKDPASIYLSNLYRNAVD